jgi:hypothetical protein
MSSVGTSQLIGFLMKPNTKREKEEEEEEEEEEEADTPAICGTAQ